MIIVWCCDLTLPPDGPPWFLEPPGPSALAKKRSPTRREKKKPRAGVCGEIEHGDKISFIVDDIYRISAVNHCLRKRW